jgi:hypothetical protein
VAVVNPTIPSQEIGLLINSHLQAESLRSRLIAHRPIAIKHFSYPTTLQNSLATAPTTLCHYAHHTANETMKTNMRTAKLTMSRKLYWGSCATTMSQSYSAIGRY